MAHTPVLIIGAGPAGSSAAATLAKAGVGCLIIDKATFPRDKLCGGLVTGRCMGLIRDVFDLEFDDTILSESSDIKLMMNGHTLSRISDHTQLNFTMRFDFDHWLLRRAVALGADLRTGVAVTEITDDHVTLSEGERITFDILIGCDGVNSRVAQHLFGDSFDPKTIGFGLEVEAPKRADHSVEIDFGVAQWGYGWVFPKRNSTTVGVGGIHRKNTDLKQRLNAYLKKQGVDPSDCKIKGQYIPFGDYRKIAGRDNIVLCGDAGGMVDPITGEGIGYAIQSGAAAARAVIQQTEPHQTAKIYQREISGIHDDLKSANRWRWLIFPKPLKPIFKRLFGGTGTLSRGYLDVMDGTKTYGDLRGLLVKRLFKRRAN